MVLWDGSPHRWFGKDTAPCCLMAAIDDATSGLCDAFFLPYECSYGYLKLLQHMVTTYGIPLAIYQDQHSSLHRNDDHWSLEEQLQGEQDPTQVGTALKALGITPIFALTPQAKGRIERLFGVLQDRLIAEMELRGIIDMDAGNRFLTEYFIEDYNRRFAREPETPQGAWRRVPKGLDIDRAIGFQCRAVVGNDHAVRLRRTVIGIPEGPVQGGYAKAKAEVNQPSDGGWRVSYKQSLIARTDLTPAQGPIRSKARKKSRLNIAREEHWVFMASAAQK